MFAPVITLKINKLHISFTSINLILPFYFCCCCCKPMDYVKGTHKGFAFVEFQDADDAAEALYNMDGAEISGKTLSVSIANTNQIKLGSHKAVWSTDEWFQKQQKENDGNNNPTEEEGETKDTQ